MAHAARAPEKTEFPEILASAEAFATEVLGPAEDELDAVADPAEAYRSDTFKTAIAEAYKLGFHKLTIPEACGGLGFGPSEFRELVEVVGRQAPGIAATLLVAPLTASLVATLGLQRRHPFYKEYLEAYLADTTGRHSSCWAVTEPHLGSDLMDTERSEPPPFRTRARWVASKSLYVIDGAKSAFVSNGWLADSVLLMLYVEGEDGSQGPGAFLMPLDLPGITRGKPIDKLGLRALNQAEIFFDGVEVPREFLLIPPWGGAFSGAGQLIVTAGNTSVGTLATAIAQSAHDIAVDYARERVQGGKAIIHHQLIKMKLFEARRDIEAARAMLEKAAIRLERGQPDTALAFMARHLACTSAVRICAEMVQVLGGYGICKEYRVEKRYRDAKLLQIMDGTLERIALTAATALYSSP